jgi:ankyrin repeat protein
MEFSEYARDRAEVFDIDLTDINGELLDRCRYFPGRVEVIIFLLDQGADIHCKDKLGNTPLLMSCISMDYEYVTLLVDRKADVNLPDIYGNSPLIMACYMGNFNGPNLNNMYKIVKYLLDHGADVNHMNDHGTSAISHACKMENCNILELLLDRNANINVPGHASALYTACSDGNYDAVKLLLKHNASINGHDPKYSPLHAACQFCYYDIVEVLLLSCSDIYQKNNLNLRPIEMALLNPNFNEDDNFEEDRQKVITVLKMAHHINELTLTLPWFQAVISHDGYINDQIPLPLEMIMHIGSMMTEGRHSLQELGVSQRMALNPSMTIETLRLLLMINIVQTESIH